jgi:wyosine [tRNA(Phe)-imidazoG37] synthetase (radical SAM superfamily)
VPSRRLGRSLGINNIPPKRCSYACVYCQVGPTLRRVAGRQEFYPPEEIVAAARDRVAAVRAAGEGIDYLSFVPDGEPTLDAHLGAEIRALKELGLRVAVITNGSLMARADVRRDLAAADWVSLKIDTVDAGTWQRINRPHPALDPVGMWHAMEVFRRDYTGTLTTETMLVEGLNDTEEHARATAGFLARLEPDVAYVAVPTRPPARPWVCSPPSETLMGFYAAVQRQVARAEYLIGYEGNAFTTAGRPDQDLLAITAVHPMREEAVDALLRKTGASWELVERLVREDQLLRVDFAGVRYYLRRPRIA